MFQSYYLASFRELTPKLFTTNSDKIGDIEHTYIVIQKAQDFTAFGLKLCT